MTKHDHESGQSLVETVVMLPVLLALFLGLYYFQALTRLRMQAVEAARYASWESIWYVREDNAGRAMKSDANLADELRALGLGAGLAGVAGNAAPRRFADFRDQVGAAPATNDAPQLFGNLFNNDTSELGTMSGELAGFVGPLSTLVDVGESAAFGAQDFFAGQTDWTGEARNSVFTAGVAYDFRGAGFFRPLPGIRIQEFSSLLGHPYNIRRTDDAAEYEELVGEADPFKCSGNGHIFDLWLGPSGDFCENGVCGVVSTALSGGKCFVKGIGGALKGVDTILGSQTSFRIPDGTLKEFPELRK